MDLQDPTWSTFTDTNSMDPVFDKEANTVRIKVPPESLQVGDIISYRRNDDIIIHRIVHVDHDEQGLYFILKGDNNPTSDPGKVRPSQVLGKIVAILY
ncbi:signal peptidase I [Candidatus Woesearchaeota archaeon]|nr:signal peptidase I [Candidatus Woesearchaeota archaeon]